MYIDPKTRKIFNYASLISCDNVPQKFKELDPDNDEHYLLTRKSEIGSTLKLFEPKQFQPAISPNTFTAQGSGFCPNDDITSFWNRVLFTKHSDTTLRLLGKAICWDLLTTSEQHSTEFFSPANRNCFNPHNVLRIDLHDYRLNLALLFSPDWLVDAFIA